MYFLFHTLNRTLRRHFYSDKLNRPRLLDLQIPFINTKSPHKPGRAVGTHVFGWFAIRMHSFSFTVLKLRRDPKLRTEDCRLMIFLNRIGARQLLRSVRHHDILDVRNRPIFTERACLQQPIKNQQSEIPGRDNNFSF